MASAPFPISVGPQYILSHRRHLFAGNRSIALSLPRRIISDSAAGVCFSSRRPPSSTSKKGKKIIEKDNEDMDEDAFEALFQQLEEDLKNDELDSGDGDIGEEELAKLEKELAEVLDDDELFGAFEYSANEGIIGTEDNNLRDDEYEHEAEDENEDFEIPVKLKNWQLRRLAHALKNGRRKTGIKSLAAELCLDRVIVLKLLRDPPPNLVMLSAALPDQPEPVVSNTTNKSIDIEPLPSPVKETPVKKELPVHVMQSNWIARKRVKKVHIQTLERVYRRTKRPTNAMISSIVHVTNLPRTRVLKWFEDKRAAEGVPDRRIPYQRSLTEESVFS